MRGKEERFWWVRHMKRVKLLPAMPTREKLLTSRCLDGVAWSDRCCQPREGFSDGSLQPQEGCGGDAQLWARGWDSSAQSCRQPRSQLLKRREAAAAREKRLKVMARWPRLDLICAVRAAAVGWLGLSAPCRAAEAGERVPCAWSALQKLSPLIE